MSQANASSRTYFGFMLSLMCDLWGLPLFFNQLSHAFRKLFLNILSSILNYSELGNFSACLLPHGRHKTQFEFLHQFVPWKAVQLKSVGRLITKPAFSTNNLSVKVIILTQIIYNLEQFSQSLFIKVTWLNCLGTSQNYSEVHLE